MLVTYSTQIAAFARDGGFPYSHYLRRVDRRTNMPWYATVLLVCLTYLLLLLALSPSASDIVYSMATLANLIMWSIPITLRLFAGERWVPGPFYTGRLSWPIHLLAVLITLYFLISRSFPPSRDIIPFNIIVIFSVLVISTIAFFLTKDFQGLDLEALEAWRYESKHQTDGKTNADVISGVDG